MKISIRARLTLLFALVFLCIFIFMLVAGGVALYVGLNEETDRTLTSEEQRMLELFESEFHGLVLEKGVKREALRDALIEEVNEQYRYKRQFVIFSLKSDTGKRIYAGGKTGDVLLLLPEGFFALDDGFTSRRFHGILYRICITQKEWGTLVLGVENQTFFEIVDEFREIVLIGVPFVMLLVFVGGRFLAKRAMRPVVAAAESADDLAVTNLGRRLSEYDKKDEFGVLVKTLNAMVARLEEGVRQIRQFTQDAAHELRTPLTILRGELELLYERDDLSDDVHAVLDKMLDRSILLNKIVDDLLLLAQSDSGQVTLERKTFRLNRVVQDVVDDVRILAEDRGLEVNLNECQPVDFSGDELLVRRLLMNLADNALKYTERGRIDFSLKSRAETVEIRIGDTGMGISEEHLPHIFDRFYRAETSRTRLSRGSGLGLSICKWIVEAHKGEIKVDSTVAKGTTVTVSLPLAAYSK
jgi:heavy metal sensor kinase